MAAKTITNYAVKNKGIAIIQFGTIFNEQTSVSLNITSFTIPRITLQTTDVTFKGVTVSLPGKAIQPETKELAFDMIIDSEWKNYKQLNRWMCGIINVNKQFSTVDTNSVVNTSDATKSIFNKYSCPITVYAINEFKKTVIALKYHNAYIFDIGEVMIEYNGDAEEIHVPLMFKYSNFEIIEGDI